MHTRRLITFLLGVWMMMLLTVALAASIGFQTAMEIAKSPPAEAARAMISIDDKVAEQIYRFVPAEINRKLFEVSGRVELGLVFLLASILFLQNYSRAATILAGVLLLAALAAHFLVTPQLVAQGQLLDFREPDTMAAERARFAKIHMIYGVMTVFRLLCGVSITGILLRNGRRTRGFRRRGDVDAIDHA